MDQFALAFPKADDVFEVRLRTKYTSVVSGLETDGSTHWRATFKVVNGELELIGLRVI